MRIAAYTARAADGKDPDPRLGEYLQVMETKEDAVTDALYEEAAIL